MFSDVGTHYDTHNSHMRHALTHCDMMHPEAYKHRQRWVWINAAVTTEQTNLLP